MRLLHALQALSESDLLPMHMPGHKRLSPDPALPYPIDITEIEGFDNLHEPTGVLQELGRRAAALYCADRAFPLVNGSTCGLLAAIRAAVPDGSTVILPRASHKSVYHALELGRLRPVYLPAAPLETVTAAQVLHALTAHPEARLVILTSPSYEGIVCDVRNIAELVHRHGAALLVDSAHGAHLGFSPAFPENAAQCGADVTILSLHKTLPALTQTALALVCGNRIPAQSLAQNLAIFETSSPSYPLLASIDVCLHLLETKRDTLFAPYAARLHAFYDAMSKLHALRLFGRMDDPFFDPGKLLIRTDGASIPGPALADLLRSRYHIEPEMAVPGWVLCMTSICDPDEAFSRLRDALLDLDAALSPAPSPTPLPAAPLPEQVLPIWKTRGLKTDRVPLSDACGRISAAYVWAYPPGIPLLTPGERIDSAVLSCFAAYKASGVALHDTFNTPAHAITVLAE